MEEPPEVPSTAEAPPPLVSEDNKQSVVQGPFWMKQREIEPLEEESKTSDYCSKELPAPAEIPSN